MENYINNDTLIDDQLSRIFKASATCPLCDNILINPLMCTICQNVYCKKCIYIWIHINKICPNKCSDSKFQECVGKKEILSKLKFRCIGCEKEILYNEVQNHHDSCCPDKKEPLLKRIDQNEFKNLKRNNNITVVQSKNY